MTTAWSDAWDAAATARREFEIASGAVELVASASMRAEAEALSDWLEGAAYSGSPWKSTGRPNNYIAATLGISPADMEGAPIEEARSFTRRAARELWGRSAPKVRPWKRRAHEDDAAPGAR